MRLISWPAGSVEGCVRTVTPRGRRRALAGRFLAYDRGNVGERDFHSQRAGFDFGARVVAAAQRHRGGQAAHADAHAGNEVALRDGFRRLRARRFPGRLANRPGARRLRHRLLRARRRALSRVSCAFAFRVARAVRVPSRLRWRARLPSRVFRWSERIAVRVPSGGVRCRSVHSVCKRFFSSANSCAARAASRFSVSSSSRLRCR